MANVLSAVAWPYANGPRHIGHVAGFGVPSDVFSRYMRMKGNRVLNVSGTDEHGTPIVLQAEEEGITPLELANKYNRVIVGDLQKLGLSYDIFTRTTTTNHQKVAQLMFKGIYENGYLFKKKQMEAWSPSMQRALPDRFIEGICPFCGYESARGDQCDHCGRQLDPLDLIHPRSKVNGETPEFIESEQFFLDLPKLTGDLSTWLNTRTAWRPNVLKFSQNLLKDMMPRAVTRDIDWGIRVPVDGWENNPHKRLYVWFDAVIGYISAAIEWSRRFGDGENWKDWWQDPAALTYYFMGKDNITFHSQIFPSMLIANNKHPRSFGTLNMPTEVVSSEFLTMEGKQFSSSRGVVIYVNDFLERYQSDALRYYIAVAGPEKQDSDFTWNDFKEKINGELVAKWGNLVSRTANLIHRHIGKIPAKPALTAADETLINKVRGTFETAGALLDKQSQKAAISTIMETVADVNKYITEQEPWKLMSAGGDGERAAGERVLYVMSDCVYNLNKMLSVFLPTSATAVDQALGQPADFGEPVIQEVTDLDRADFKYPIITGDYSKVRQWEYSPITSGATVVKPSILFQKITAEQVEQEIEKLKNSH
jgi:methionyl-tRNA synthetase